MTGSSFFGSRRLRDGPPRAVQDLNLKSERGFTEIDGRHYLLVGEVHALLGDDARLSEYRGREAALLHRLHVQHGHGLQKILDGDFVALVFDGAAGRLSIYNSRYQATRLYYYLGGGMFAFASSLATLLDNLPAPRELRKPSIAAFLDTGFSKTERTLLENIHRLLPTASLHLEGHDVRVSSHWHDEYRFARRPFHDLEQKLGEYEREYRGGIANFLEAARPAEVGCLLSGGHDTSYTLIQASKVHERPIHSFTAAFAGSPFDESPKARYVSELCRATHHRVEVGPAALDLVPRLVSASEEPVSGSSLAIYCCAAEASRHVDAVIAGDAGDTLWGEYYPVAEWHRLLKALPSPALRLLRGLNRAALKVMDWERLWESEHVLSLFARRDMYHDFFNRLCTYRHFSEEELSRCLSSEYLAAAGDNPCHIELPVTRDNFFDALVETKMLYGVYLYMVPPTQKSLESLGLKFYTPYNNIKLINFINALPEEWLNSGTSLQKLTNSAHQRRFHKQALLKYLPGSYVSTLQQSLDVPFHGLFRGRHGILDNLLARLKRRPWFNGEYLDRLFNEFPLQKVKAHELMELKHHGYRIYSLLTLEVWCMQFLDGDRRSLDLPLERYLL